MDERLAKEDAESHEGITKDFVLVPLWPGYNFGNGGCARGDYHQFDEFTADRRTLLADEPMCAPEFDGFT